MSVLRDAIEADLVEVDDRRDCLFAFVTVPRKIDIGGFDDEAGVFDQLRPVCETFGAFPFDVEVMLVPSYWDISILANEGTC